MLLLSFVCECASRLRNLRQLSIDIDCHGVSKVLLELGLRLRRSPFFLSRTCPVLVLIQILVESLSKIRLNMACAIS